MIILPLILTECHIMMILPLILIGFLADDDPSYDLHRIFAADDHPSFDPYRMPYHDDPSFDPHRISN